MSAAVPSASTTATRTGSAFEGQSSGQPRLQRPDRDPEHLCCLLVPQITGDADFDHVTLPSWKGRQRPPDSPNPLLGGYPVDYLVRGVRGSEFAPGARQKALEGGPVAPQPPVVSDHVERHAMEPWARRAFHEPELAAASPALEEDHRRQVVRHDRRSRQPEAVGMNRIEVALIQLRECRLVAVGNRDNQAGVVWRRSRVFGHALHISSISARAMQVPAPRALASACGCEAVTPSSPGDRRGVSVAARARRREPAAAGPGGPMEL